ncbi:MAG: dTDP-4-dehydrorhamnose 3,5-epimerase [Tenacibaculum sp.]
MHLVKTPLKDCFILEPQVFVDSRGYFFENYNQKKIEKLSLSKLNFVQDNEAFSNRGIIRGLHFQKGKHAQAKLVRVIKGKVLDAVVDLRKNSPSYGSQFSVILSEENKKQLFIPKGFAHGYSVLENNTIFSYKCDNYYCKASEDGIIYNDKTLNINWMLTEQEMQLSDKDKALPEFIEHAVYF